MKKLVRSKDQKLAGVCGGIAEYFQIDPNIVRLAVVALGIVTAFIPVALGYFVAVLIIPEESDVL